MTGLFLLSACQSTKTPRKERNAEELARLGDRESSEKKANPSEVAIVRGKLAMERRDATEAINHFNVCLQISPENEACRWELGWAHFMAHDYSRAGAEWEILQLLNPERAGLKRALERAKNHLRLQARIWKLRKESPSSFLNNYYLSAKDQLIIRAVGDTMLGTEYPKPMLPTHSPLLGTRPWFQGSDVNFLNHEGVLCDGESKSKCEFTEGTCYAFRSPIKFGEWIQEAGFNLVSLANNHVMDFGGACQEETEKEFDALEIPWSGRKDTVARFEKKGIPLSLIAFHTADHTNNVRDIERAKKLVSDEKQSGRLVIVSFHAGAEGFNALRTPQEKEIYFGENRGDVRAFAHTVVDAGADLVIGHGPHVVRGIEFYKEKVIAYSLGNFATYKAFNLAGPNAFGAVLEVVLDKSGNFRGSKIIPTVQKGFGIPQFDESHTAIDLIRYLSKVDFPEYGMDVALDGSLGKRPPAIPAPVMRAPASKTKSKKPRKPRQKPSKR